MLQVLTPFRDILTPKYTLKVDILHYMKSDFIWYWPFHRLTIDIPYFSLTLSLCCVLLQSYETSSFMWVLVWGVSVNRKFKQPRAHVTRDRWQYTWGTNAGMQDNYWCLQILEWSFENINLHLFGLSIIILLLRMLKILSTTSKCSSQTTSPPTSPPCRSDKVEILPVLYNLYIYYGIQAELPFKWNKVNKFLILSNR